MEATCKRLSGAIDLPQVGGCRREAEGESPGWVKTSAEFEGGLAAKMSYGPLKNPSFWILLIIRGSQCNLNYFVISNNLR